MMIEPGAEPAISPFTFNEFKTPAMMDAPLFPDRIDPLIVIVSISPSARTEPPSKLETT